MSWRFTPTDAVADPVAGARGLRRALSAGPRARALAAWLNLAHRAQPEQVATYSYLLSTNPDITDLEAHLAARVAKRPSPARIEDLADAARHVHRPGASVHRRIARNLELFGDVVIAGCPANPERHAHQRTPGGWLCGDTTKRADSLTDPRPADR